MNPEDNLNFEDLKELADAFQAFLDRGETPSFDEEEFETIIDYFLDLSQPEKAQKACEYALEAFPFTSEFIVKKAEIYIELNRWDEAEEIIQNASFIDPDDVSLILIKSDILIYRGKHEEAIELLTDALEDCEDEDRDTLYLELADVYEDKELYHEVIECLKSALMANPENDEAYNRLWFSVELTEQFEDSIKFHKKIVDEAPYTYQAWYNLGHAYSGVGRYTEAIEAFEFVITIEEEYDAVFVDCADLYFYLGEYKKAIEYYLEADKICRQHKDVYLNIGLCYEHIEENNKARLFYRKAIAHDSTFSEATHYIGRTYLKENKITEAIPFLEKAAKQEEQNVKFLALLADAYAQNDELVKAANLYTKIIELDNESYEVWVNLALIYFGMEDYEMAISILDNAQKQFKNCEISYTKCVLLLEKGDKHAALEALQHGLEQNFEAHKIIFEINPTLTEDDDLLDFIDLFSKK